MSTLRALILDAASDIHAIQAHLDAMAPDALRAAVDTLDRRAQRALYNKAKDSPPLDLAHFVPAALAPLQPVHHHGRNTLPLPGTFRRFQKRFCRPDDGSARLFGFNEASTRGLLGPGYFVALATAPGTDWAARGSVVVDYFQVPDGAVVAGWPTVVPNNHGLQALVYNGTRDFMRGVSQTVSIGAAYKGEKALDHYFVLVRLAQPTD